MGRRTTGMSPARRGLRAAVVSLGVATALVAVVAVLGGCESAETPPPTSSASASATSAAPSPSPTAPSPSVSAGVEIPAAAREKSDKGAEAFVRFFVAESSRAWTTADPALIQDQSDADCDSCINLATTAEKLRQAGHHYSAAPISVTSTEVLTGDGIKQNVAASIKQHAVDVVDDKGVVISSDKADNLERTFLLYWKEERWVVGGIA